ncbi:MAG: hypothetical protein EOP88_17190 [Verrucomicrobiaceae bacterium]|nr:MAG: hypothetical protein EOP88_17190 [Verrucomicrobiaceae bacterium]
MNLIAKAPITLLEMIAREDSHALRDLGLLSPNQKSDLFAKLGVVQLVNAAAFGTKGGVVKAQAKTLRVSVQAINHWLKCYKDHGFRGLIDGRKAAAKGRTLLPDVTRQWIKDQILNCQRRDAIAEVHRMTLAQWRKWQRTGDPQWALPGFTSPPPDAGKGMPAGFSIANFERCAPDNYQKTLAAQGTIAAYRQLPSILSTCVGTRYLEYVFFDDEKPDVNVRALGYDRPMVPLCFHALDRLTRYPFRPHIRLRWFDADKKTHKHLTQKEFVWYVIFLLCTEGYRTDEVGTTYIQEHGTAKVWKSENLVTPDGFHSFADAVRAITARDGMPGVRLDDSGLFNKPAFSELIYGPQSSGNPRFKAPIESSFHLWRIYSQHLRGQTGRNIEMAPEENYGIAKYERSILKIGMDLPRRIQESLISNYATGIEFGMVAELIRLALAARDDHSFEGWYENGFVEPVWRWAEDPVGTWRSRSELAGLPDHLREHALHQQRHDKLLTDIKQWNPAQAREACLDDPHIAKLSLFDAIHLVPTAWLKPATFNDRNFIEVTEELLPGVDLQYLPELTTLRGRTEVLRRGDKVMILLNPLMPDTILVYDEALAPIGTLTRNVPLGRNDDQVEELFRQRSRIEQAYEAPVRRAMQGQADRRQVVKAMNDDLIMKARAEAKGEPATEAERHSAAGQKAARTAAANRLRKHGDEVDWDKAEMPASSARTTAFDKLPDDVELPDAL